MGPQKYGIAFSPLQRVGGGTWAGCVYDVDRIIAALDAGTPPAGADTSTGRES